MSDNTEPRPLTDLIGLDPDFTGGMSTDEYLRRMRCGECDEALKERDTAREVARSNKAVTEGYAAELEKVTAERDEARREFNLRSSAVTNLRKGAEVDALEIAALKAERDEAQALLKRAQSELGIYRRAENGNPVLAEIREMDDLRMREIGEVRRERDAAREQAEQAQAERDLLGRQQQAILDLCHGIERVGGASVVLGMIYDLLITDPANSDKPLYEDFSWSGSGAEQTAELSSDPDRPLFRLDVERLREFVGMAADTLDFLDECRLGKPLPAAAPDPAPHCGLVPPSDIDGIGSCVRPAGHAGDHLGPDTDDIAWQWSPAACIADDPDHAGMTCDQYDTALDAKPGPADTCGHQYPGSLRQPGDRPILCTLPPHTDDTHREPETGSFWSHPDGQQWASVAISDPRPVPTDGGGEA